MEPEPQLRPAYLEAERYAKLGVSVIPVASGTKAAPYGFVWGAYRERHADSSERWLWFQEQGHDIGVITGTVSGNLVVLDFDSDDGFDAMAEEYPGIRNLPRVRTGSGRCHAWLLSPEPTRTYHTKTPNGGRLEVRGEGVLTVAPPSTHPSGGVYRWEVEPGEQLVSVDLESIGLRTMSLEPTPEELTPLETDSGLAEEEKAEITRIIAPAWYEGQRHNLALGLAGWLAHYGVPEADALDIMYRLMRENGEPRDTVNAIPAVVDTYRKANAGVSVAGWTLLTDRSAPLINPNQEKRLTMLLRYRNPVMTLVSKGKPKEETRTHEWITDVADLLGEDDEPDVWQVDGFVRQPMVGLIVGPPKTYKSIFVQELAIAVATGTRFLEEYDVPEPRTVIYLQEESARRALRKRFRGIMAGRGMQAGNVRDWLYTITNEQFRLDEPDHIRRLIEEGIEKHEAQLVIMDPLRELHVRDENSAQEMREIMAVLKEIRDTYNVSILVVHHNNKNIEARNPAESIRGSTAIWGAMDGGIFLQDTKQDGEKKVAVVLKEGGQAADFIYRPHFEEDGAITFETFPVGDGKRPAGVTDAQIIAAIAAGDGWMPTSDIAGRVGMSERRIRPRLKALAATRKLRVKSGANNAQLWNVATASADDPDF